MYRLAAHPPGDAGQQAPQAPPPDVGPDDWSDLLAAVRDRLLQIGTRHPPPADPRAGVLACAAALERLHTTLPHQLGRRRQSRLDDSGEPRSSPGLAVFYIGLDGYRMIHQTHGRATGDALLRIVAARLGLRVRAGDVVDRLGVEDFCVLLGGAPDRQRLQRLAGRLFDAVAAPVRIGPIGLWVRPSIGIAISPSEGITPHELLACAAAAMRRARRARTGHAFFHDDGSACASPLLLPRVSPPDLQGWEAEGGAPAGGSSWPGSLSMPLSPADAPLLERLGTALVGEWDGLPTPLQRALYDRAVAADARGGDAVLKHDVARLLHDHKARHASV